MAFRQVLLTKEAGQFVSKTLPPKINLHEGRGRRKKGTSLSAGTEGKSLRFNGIKTAHSLVAFRLDHGGRSVC